MNTLGPKGEMHIYLEAASGFSRHGLEQEPLIAILQVFCECSARFLMYVTLSTFLLKCALCDRDIMLT
jgi:hypothetical protein